MLEVTSGSNGLKVAMSVTQCIKSPCNNTFSCILKHLLFKKFIKDKKRLRVGPTNLTLWPILKSYSY
ncbi:hypothetical protein Hanom_Chr01g00048061 [Helianthus anomalus]